MTERDLILNRGCDTILAAAAGAMQEMGAEPERIVDRALTFGAAQIVAWHGSALAAEVLHELADKVAAGTLAVLEPITLRRPQ